jgi:stage V sporulation protein SpoVS
VGAASTFYIASESQTQSVAGAIAGSFTGSGATNTAITAGFALTQGGVGRRLTTMGAG